MEWNGDGKEMKWKKWLNNDFVKWIRKWHGVEYKLNGKNYNLRMELGWNGIEYLVESHREGNGNGMERN